MHIGFIMDGNRRWAKDNKVAIHKQHEDGAKNLHRIIEASYHKWIEVVSFWGLAYKNIKERSHAELNALYDLTEKFMDDLLKEYHEYDIRFEIVGDVRLIRDTTQKALKNLCDATKLKKGMRCVLAIGYGWQREIVQAVQRYMKAWNTAEACTEELLNSYMDTGSLPIPDLIIRTWADHRLRHSGFFLYASEYSEYYFTKTLWPDFDEKELGLAVDSLKLSERNFWK